MKIYTDGGLSLGINSETELGALYSQPSSEDSLSELSEAALTRAYKNAGNWVQEHMVDCTHKEDVVQEALLSAWRGFGTFTGGDKDFDNWISAIVHNRMIDHWRKEHASRNRSLEGLRRKEIMYSPDGSLEFPLVHAGDAPYLIDNTTSFIEEFISTREVIKQTLKTSTSTSSVGEESVEILFKCRLLGMSHEEIAQELGISIVACKARLFHLRQLVKVALQNTDE